MENMNRREFLKNAGNYAVKGGALLLTGIGIAPYCTKQIQHGVVYNGLKGSVRDAAYEIMAADVTKMCFSNYQELRKEVDPQFNQLDKEMQKIITGKDAKFMEAKNPTINFGIDVRHNSPINAENANGNSTKLNEINIGKTSWSMINGKKVFHKIGTDYNELSPDFTPSELAELIMEGRYSVEQSKHSDYWTNITSVDKGLETIDSFKKEDEELVPTRPYTLEMLTDGNYENGEAVRVSAQAVFKRDFFRL